MNVSEMKKMLSFDATEFSPDVDSWEKAIVVIENALTIEKGISPAQLLEALDFYEAEFGDELDLEIGMGDDVTFRISDIRDAVCNIELGLDDIGVIISVNSDGKITAATTDYCMKLTWLK